MVVTLCVVVKELAKEAVAVQVESALNLEDPSTETVEPVVLPAVIAPVAVVIEVPVQLRLLNVHADEARALMVGATV